MSVRETLLVFVILFVMNLPHAYSNTPFISIDWPQEISRQNFQGPDSYWIYNVKEGTPLKIIFKNIDAFNIHCECDACIGQTMTHQNFPENTQVAYISEVTARMSTKWMCIAEDVINVETIYFELKVIGSRRVPVTINNYELVFFYPANNSGQSFDGVATYEGVEGQLLAMVIGYPNDVSWYLQISSYNSGGNKTKEFNVPKVRPTVANIRLERTIHNSHIRCTLSSRMYKQIFTYAVIFKIRGFTPNQWSLNPRISERNEGDTTENRYNMNTTETATPKHIPEKPPVILGLPKGNNILYQNNTNPETSEIVYLYRVNETATLICTGTLGKKLQWVIQEKEKTLVEFHAKNLNIITRTFNFKAEDNGTSIICESKCEADSTNIQKAIIRLHLITDLEGSKPTKHGHTYPTSTTITRYDELPKNQPVNSTSVTEHDTLDMANSEDNKTNIIIACVAAIIAVAIIAGAIIFWCRRSRRTDTAQGYHENLVPEDKFRTPVAREPILPQARAPKDALKCPHTRTPQDPCTNTYDYAYNSKHGLRTECSRHGQHMCEQHNPSVNSDESETHYYSVINQYSSYKRKAPRQ